MEVLARILGFLRERTLEFFRQRCTRIYEALEHASPRVSLLAEVRSQTVVHGEKNSVRARQNTKI